jgi:hypothetical protein
VRAFVTGGAGFIGSNLVDRLLAEGHAVDVIDDLSTGSLANLSQARASGGAFRFHQIDVTDDAVGALIGRRRPEIVFHLAGQPSVAASVRDPGRDAAVNVVGSVRVLDGARRADVRKIVYAASGGTLYGEVEPRELPIDETHPFRPISPYGISKKVAIDYFAAFRDRYGLEFTALALANVYGPRQDAHGEAGVVARFAADLVAGRAASTPSAARSSVVVGWFSTSARGSRPPSCSSTRRWRRRRGRSWHRPAGRLVPATCGRTRSTRPGPSSTSAGCRGPHSRRASRPPSPLSPARWAAVPGDDHGPRRRRGGGASARRARHRRAGGRDHRDRQHR